MHLVVAVWFLEKVLCATRNAFTSELHRIALFMCLDTHYAYGFKLKSFFRREKRSEKSRKWAFSSLTVCLLHDSSSTETLNACAKYAANICFCLCLHVYDSILDDSSVETNKHSIYKIRGCAFSCVEFRLYVDYGTYVPLPFCVRNFGRPTGRK